MRYPSPIPAARARCRCAAATTSRTPPRTRQATRYANRLHGACGTPGPCSATASGSIAAVAHAPPRPTRRQDRPVRRPTTPRPPQPRSAPRVGMRKRRSPPSAPRREATLALRPAGERFREATRRLAVHRFDPRQPKLNRRTQRPHQAPQRQSPPNLTVRRASERLRGQDLNLRPSGYEPDELPDCSTPRWCSRSNPSSLRVKGCSGDPTP